MPGLLSLFPRCGEVGDRDAVAGVEMPSAVLAGHGGVLGVDQGVVVEAQQGTVGQVGRPVVGPADACMVGFTEGWRSAAARVGTVPVAGNERTTLGAGEGAMGPAVVDDFVLGGEQDPIDLATGGQTPEQGSRNWSGAIGPRCRWCVEDVGPGVGFRTGRGFLKGCPAEVCA